MGILDRFAEKLSQRKRVLTTEYKQAKAAKKIIRKKGKAEYLRALEKEKLAVARSRAKEHAQPLSTRLGKAFSNTGKAVKAHKSKISKKRGGKLPTGIAGPNLGGSGPNIGTPKDDDLFTIKDFRKKE